MPFNALLTIAQEARSHSESVSVEEDLQTQWTGIGFRLLGGRWVAPMAQISEILEYPLITNLLNVQPWVLGVANIRGRLLPIINFAEFFGGSLINPKKMHRVLVLESDDIYMGLVVDQSYGIQHFKVEHFYSQAELNVELGDGVELGDSVEPGDSVERDAASDPFYSSVIVNNPLLSNCTKGVYPKTGHDWYVLNMMDLIQTDAFLSVSLN